MKREAAALAFLLRRSLKNRVLRQLQRLRTPRYAIAALVGVGYIGAMVWSQIATATVRPGGPPPAVGGFAGLGMALLVLYWWTFGKESSALVFKPPEVQFLFQAPLTRRQLIGFKVVKTQVPLVFGCLVWALLSQNWGVQVSGVLRVLSLWGLFTAISLHHLGVALVQARPLSGTRLRVATGLRVIGVCGAAALAMAVLPVLAGSGGLPLLEGMKRLGEVLERGAAAWVLAPIRILYAPMYAVDASEWGLRFAAVLGVLGAHLVWVLGMNVPFEEAAAKVTADVAVRVAALRSRGGSTGATLKRPRTGRFTLPLASHGIPAVAIAWKNALSYWRTGSLRAMAIILVPIVVGSVVLRGTEGSDRGAVALIPVGTFLLITLLMGPQVVRADLRQDLQQLGVIKTWPVGGTALVLAELVAPTAVLTVLQLIVLGAGVALAPALGARYLGPSGHPLLILLIPIALVGLNAVGFVIQNALALMFPAWVRLGPDGGGVEMFGQRILVTFGSVLLLLLALLVPVGVGVGLAMLLASPLGRFAPLAGSLTGLALLLFEVGFAVVLLGELFERTEPSALG